MTAVAALAVAVILALTPAVQAARFQDEFLFLAAAGLVLLAASLVLAWPRGIAWALAAVGSGWLLSLYAGAPPAKWEMVGAGAGLLLAGELAYWSVSLRWPARREPRLAIQHMIFLGVLTLGAIALGALLEAVAQLTVAGSLGLLAIGAVAAVAALTLVWRLAWRGQLAPSGEASS